MIKFSEKNQAFYDTDMDYTDLPADLIDIDTEQHLDLLSKINSGHHVFSDLTYTDAKPSPHHIWKDNDWIDPRTPAEIEAHRLAQFPALKRRQFMRVLVLNGFDLDQIEAEINKIPDTQTRQLALIDWKDATEFWRTDETLLMVADLLGLDTARIDAMWEQALTL
ncbi:MULTISPECIES: hypothetical protein [Acinetobacter]|uniref:hypothetical protein n=1 Tax=Acinetobacter TaxID=469 RepID=UPI002FBD78DC